MQDLSASEYTLQLSPFHPADFLLGRRHSQTQGLPCSHQKGEPEMRHEKEAALQYSSVSSATAADADADTQVVGLVCRTNLC